MYSHKINTKWLFASLVLLQVLVATEAFGGPKEECEEAGGIYQDSGSCTCKDVPFSPQEFFCTEAASFGL